MAVIKRLAIFFTLIPTENKIDGFLSLASQSENKFQEIDKVTDCEKDKSFDKSSWLT